MAEGTYTYAFWGLNNPIFAIQINSGNYIVSDYGNGRIVELDSTLSAIIRDYYFPGVTFFDFSEANETLLVTSQVLNRIREVSWGKVDFGTTLWESTYALSSPQCATYKQNDVSKIVIADTGNNRIVKCDRVYDTYTPMTGYQTSGSASEISNFYKPCRVTQYLDGRICVTEKEGRPTDFATIESSSSSSSTEAMTTSSSSSSSSTEYMTSSSSSSSSPSSSSSSSPSSSSSTEYMTSSSSSSSGGLYVSGSITPNATGNYYRTANYFGNPCFNSDDNLYTLWYFSGNANWYITNIASKGNAVSGKGWRKLGPSYYGTYSPVPDGTPYVGNPVVS